MLSKHENTAEETTSQRINFTLNGIYVQGDKVMTAVMWLMLLVSFGLANWYDTWQEAFIIGMPAAIISTVLMKMMPGTRLTRVVNGIAFMVISALLIHQGHGMIELHFSIFALLAFLLYYRDWLPIVVSAAVIALHHLSFNFLQESGYGLYIFEARSGVDIVLVHVAFVIFESAVLIYMSLQLHREGVLSEEVNEIARHLVVTDETIDLRLRNHHSTNQFSIGINTFMDAIHRTIMKAKDVSQHLVGTANELNKITETSAIGVHRQQQETDHVSTAINEMAITIQGIARNTEEAANFAASAENIANEGQQVVSETVSTINHLEEKIEHASDVISNVEQDSDSIGAVLDVIKGIAEQTNLLALNAAIEAARAGEQGRGFAVVADEVRTLASRTQQSTSEIQEMIERLQNGSKDAVHVMEEGRSSVQQSVAQAAKAGEALSAIVQSINKIRDMNTQIATASEQQGVVAEEVNRKIVTIRGVAEETATEIERASSSSDQLANLANQLEKLVNGFKV